MSRDEGAIFLWRSSDPDWEMFCRGRGDAASHGPGACVDDAGPSPITLEPDAEDRASAPPPRGARVVHFAARVAGVAYPNGDGSSRREAVKKLRRWERVRLVHRPDNPVDASAVAVLREGDGRQLGYLPAAVAGDVVVAARTGTRYLAVVAEISGAGHYDFIAGGAVGATLLVLSLEGVATLAMARQYLLDLMNAR